ncbi:MAG: DUF342 domain-containing protein [Spirochaetales bacterium]|nr:DUF342 domain-containing protein [Spirochaetales bacterium]
MYKYEEILEMREYLTLLNQWENEEKDELYKEGLFFNKDDAIFEIEEEKESDFEIDQQFIAMRRIPEKHKFIALETGFLFFNSQGRLSIISLTFLNREKSRLYIRKITTKEREEEFKDKIIEKLVEFDRRFWTKSFDTMGTKELQGFIALSEGIPVAAESSPAKYAQDTKIIWEKELGNKKFIELEQDQLILTLKKHKEGVNGVDLYGNDIVAGSPNIVNLRINENIIDEESDTEVKYFAKIAGALFFNNNGLTLEPELIIKGSLDHHFGDIEFSRKIIIKGEIEEGISVKGGDEIEVEGIVSNNVKITCNKNLFAKHGITGHETIIKVNGNLITKFIQESNIKAGGSVEVEEFIYEAKIFAGGNIRVKGEHLKADNKGCVIGGEIAAFHNVDIHSVGTTMNMTHILCGVDPSLSNKIVQLRNYLNSLRRKKISIQNNLNFNVENKDVLEILKRMTPHQKESLKEKLLEIKNITQLYTNYSEKLIELEKKYINPKIEDLSITIHNQIIPDVKIQMGKEHLEIKKPDKGKKYIIRSDNIVIKTLS